jgi:hypothetical protein
MKICWLLLFGFVVTTASTNAATISYDISQVGLDVSGNMVYNYTYTVSGITLQSTQELDLFFDPAVFNTLSDPVAASAFQTILIQPNNPPGAPGDFGLIPNADNTVLDGPFSIDFTLTGPVIPGSQSYTITQYLSNGVSIGVVASGTTIPIAVTAVPEPSLTTFMGMGLLLGMAVGVSRCRISRHSD